MEAAGPAGRLDSSSLQSHSGRQPALYLVSNRVTARFTAAEAADPAIAGPDADSDGDGLSNTHEYVFGTGPLSRVTVTAGIALTLPPA